MNNQEFSKSLIFLVIAYTILQCVVIVGDMYSRLKHRDSECLLIVVQRRDDVKQHAANKQEQRNFRQQR